MIHGPQKVKRQGSDRIKEELEHEAVAQLDKDQIKSATCLLAVLGKEKINVDRIHSHQRDEKSNIANHVVGDKVENDNTRWRKGIESPNLSFAVENTHDRRGREDNQVGSAGRIRAQVRCQKDLVI